MSVGLQPYQPTYTGFMSSYVLQGVVDARPIPMARGGFESTQLPLRLEPVRAEAKAVSGWSSFFSWLLSLFLIATNPNQNLSTTTTRTTTTTTTTRTGGFTVTTVTGQTTRAFNYGCPLGQNGKYCDQCGLSSASVNAKIVGGTAATPHSYPAQAYIEFNYVADVRLPSGATVNIDQTYSCGGTLITRDTVLTAAHCVPSSVTYNGYTVPVQTNTYKPTLGSMFTVYLGMHDISAVPNDLKGGLKMTVAQVYRHESFNEQNYLNDIAILKLSSEVQLNTNIQVACLPDPARVGYPTTVNTPIYAAGWGTLRYQGSSPSVLYNVKMTYYDGSSCSSVYPTMPKNYSTQICAGESTGGKDTCQGDSGGSIYMFETVAGSNRMISAGVVSYGDGCAQVGKPGLYTRVSAYLDWINQYL